jgi:hypothetical protein
MLECEEPRPRFPWGSELATPTYGGADEMKKFPFATRTWKSGSAALGALAGLALAPAPAHAQPCADVTDIANSLRTLYLDEFDVFFTLDQKSCDTLQKTFYSACTTAVKDAVKCWDRQIGTLPKAAKSVCTQVVKPDQCNQTYKNDAKNRQNEIDSEATAEYVDCQTKAGQLFASCFVN